MGHSLSVSDIIALKVGDQVSYHYIDSAGFREVTQDFARDNPVIDAQMPVSGDSGEIGDVIGNGEKLPTVAELERQASSGNPISLMDLAAAVHREKRAERPSVMEKLKQHQSQPREKTAPKKSAEKER